VNVAASTETREAMHRGSNAVDTFTTDCYSHVVSAEIVRATHLSRTFGARVAVRDLSLSLDAGEIVVLLGPNGAGKTTTLRMLAGLIPPSAGEIVLHGIRFTAASADTLRRHIGLLTESPGLWDRLTVRLNLLTYARLYSLPRPHDAVDRALSMVGLSDRARDAAGALSKGLRQRLAVARALMHEPSIVLLDEPTAGLDPASARHLRDLILDLRGQGRALLVSTHNLAEAEEIADRIAVLNTNLLAIDTPAALTRMLKEVRLEIEVEGEAERWIEDVQPLVESLSASGSTMTATLATDEKTADLVARLVHAGARIRRVAPAERTLEEVYLSLVGHEERAS
jgi:ABC-2 type transport system ATP-binding protein